MLRNYIKVAYRNLLNQKFYSLLNILGLSIGIACCLLIAFYVLDELSFDKFYENADRICRVGLMGKIAGQEIQTTNTCPPLATVAIQEFPEVINSTRIFVYDNNQVIRYGEKVWPEEKVYYADSTFFELFDFKLIEGNSATALKEPNTMVLTQPVAQKYFGDDIALGKTLVVGNDKKTYTVTGVMEPLPSNSHFDFTILFSMATMEYSRNDGWLNNSFMTYLLLHPDASPQELESKLGSLVEKYVGSEIQQYLGMSLETFQKQGGKYGYFLQPMPSIHLYSHISDEMEPSGDIAYVYIFSAIALFIILIACINFMNLSTARSSNRAKEVGIRKTLGTQRKSLIIQFMAESVMVSFISTLLALILAALLLPGFNNISGKSLSLWYFTVPGVLAGLLGLMLVVGLLAGSYPAFYLSSFKPVEVLKGKLIAGMKSKGIRNGLVVFQFFISISLIICTSVVYNQLLFARNKNLGFNKENVLVISNLYRLPEGKQQAFREELINQSQVINASISNNVPPGVNNTSIFRNKTTDEDHIVSTYNVDYNHLPTMQLSLVLGRNFSKEYLTDTAAILINEAAVKEFGYENPLNEIILSPFGKNDDLIPYKVIGVMKDFNYESLRNKVRPLALKLTENGSNLSVRIATGDARAIINMVEEKWKSYAPDEPFEYSFLDEDYDALFRTEQRLGKVFSIFTGFAILVACLGLLGLATFTAEQRTKEIGIRKVLGASVTHVVVLLSKEFTKLVVIAFLLAMPVAYFSMYQWLQEFAFRTEIKPGIFILAGIAALLIAWVTVSFQAIKAASVNPVKSLKSE